MCHPVGKALMSGVMMQPTIQSRLHVIVAQNCLNTIHVVYVPINGDCGERPGIKKDKIEITRGEVLH